MQEVSTVLRVDWISTTGASEDLNKLLNNLFPHYKTVDIEYCPCHSFMPTRYTSQQSHHVALCFVFIRCGSHVEKHPLYTMYSPV